VAGLTNALTGIILEDFGRATVVAAMLPLKLYYSNKFAKRIACDGQESGFPLVLDPEPAASVSDPSRSLSDA
jgi:hypothetical protein